MINNLRVRDKFGNFSFILPALLIFGVFYIYPFFKVFQLSMFEWDGISLQAKFVGLRNFQEIMLKDQYWWKSMLNAGYITLWALTFQNFLAFMLALAVDKTIRTGNIYRVIFFIPPILSEVVVGLVWKWIYNGDYGVLNFWLSKIGLGHLAQSWLSSPSAALTAVAMVHCWKGFGWGFIILLAGLQTIPEQLYEAARVDGAGAWNSFWRITVPLMVPVIFMVIILTILGSMQAFVLILSMTGGGPGHHTEVPVTRIIASMLSSSRFGYACAQGLIFGGILMMVSFIQVRISRVLKKF